MSFSGYSINARNKDTTIVLAYEICSDSTLLNCWAINQGDYHMSGLVPYDSLSGEVKYENGYYIYYSPYLNSNMVDSIVFLDFKSYKNETSLAWINNVQLPFDSVLRAVFLEENKLVKTDRRFNIILKRNKNSNKYFKLNSISRNNYKISGDRLYYLFKINFEYVPSKTYFSDRMVITQNGKLKKINIPYFFIVKVNSIKPFKVK